MYSENLGGKDPMQSQLHRNPDGLINTWTYDPIVTKESLCQFITATDSPISLSEFYFYEDHIVHNIKV